MARLTRKEYIHYAKIFGWSLLASIPLLIILDILIFQHVNQGVLIFLNVVLIIACYIVALVISEKRAKHIAKKREEFLAKQELQKKHANTKDQKE